MGELFVSVFKCQLAENAFCRVALGIWCFINKRGHCAAHLSIDDIERKTNVATNDVYVWEMRGRFPVTSMLQPCVVFIIQSRGDLIVGCDATAWAGIQQKKTNCYLDKIWAGLRFHWRHPGRYSNSVFKYTRFSLFNIIQPLFFRLSRNVLDKDGWAHERFSTYACASTYLYTTSHIAKKHGNYSKDDDVPTMNSVSQ